MKSSRAVYTETQIRVACYMAVSERRWIKAAWEHEKLKDHNSLKITAEAMANEVGHTLTFKDEGIELDGERTAVWTLEEKLEKYQRSVEERKRNFVN